MKKSAFSQKCMISNLAYLLYISLAQKGDREVVDGLVEGIGALLKVLGEQVLTTKLSGSFASKFLRISVVRCQSPSAEARKASFMSFVI